MFIIKSLHLENFMSIDSASFEFSDNQVTAITGQNGQGKSSLFYAVAFCLTGYRKGESFRDYIKVGNQSAKIQLTGLFNGYPISYDMEIYDSVSPTKRKIIYKDKTYLNSEFTQFVNEFGLNELEKLMFMLQGSSEIIEAKPAERASLLKKLFRFEFPDIVEGLKADQERNKLGTTEQNAVLSELTSRTFEKLPLMRETTPASISEWENRLGVVKDSLGRISDIDEKELEACENRMSSTRSSISSVRSHIEQDKVSVGKLRNQVAELDAFLAGCDVEKLDVDIDRMRNEISRHESDHNRAAEENGRLSDELSILQYREKELSAQYDISRTGVCHACGQPIEKEHVEKLKNELDSTTSAIAAKKKEISDLGFDKRDLKGKELKRKLSEMEDVVKRHASETRNREGLMTRISDLDNLIKERNTTLEGLEETLSDLQEKKATLSAIAGLLQERNSLLAEKNDIESRLQSARDNRIKNEERRSTNERVDRDKAERDRRVSEINGKLDVLAKQAVRIKEEIDIFETRFPNYIVLQACEKLEEVINSIVQNVFPYCRVSLKLSKGGVNFFYLSESSDDEWIPVSMASGAQRQVLSIAYFIALARLSGISCVFLDEIDASMSAENAAIIYDFIGGLDYFPQVFFISHRPEAVEAIKRKNDKLVTYRVENGSYMEI